MHGIWENRNFVDANLVTHILSTSPFFSLSFLGRPPKSTKGMFLLEVLVF